MRGKGIGKVGSMQGTREMHISSALAKSGMQLLEHYQETPVSEKKLREEKEQFWK